MTSPKVAAIPSRRSANVLTAVLLTLLLVVALALVPAPAQAAPRVTASSAGTKTVGVASNAWGSVSGFAKQVKVSTQVKVNGKWSTSQTSTTTGYYALPLTYGSTTPGTYTWRVVATDGQSTATSAEFTFTRTAKPSVTATSAGTKTVGHDTHVWGSHTGFKGTVKVSTQVQVMGQWSTSQTITSTTGQHTIPLTYGKHTAGTYTWRVVATDGSTTATSSVFTLRRTAAASSSIPDSVWAALAQCESSGNPRAVSSTGRYHGLYQFSVATWRSVGGTGLPSQATPEEQTNRARILQARSGWGQWPACSRKLGLS